MGTSGTTKTVTLGDAVDAIIENGLPKYEGWEKRDKKGELVAACSIAQGARNLGVTYSSLSRALAAIDVFDGASTETHLSSYIMRLNDGSSRSVKDIGEEAARRVKALRGLPLTVTVA
jgi:hypothetical protein